MHTVTAQGARAARSYLLTLVTHCQHRKLDARQQRHPTPARLLSSVPNSHTTLHPATAFTAAAALHTCCRYYVHVIIPCHQEKLQVVQHAVLAALAAELPPGTTRAVYLCDDGKDPGKWAWAKELSDKGLVYAGSRSKQPGELGCRRRELAGGVQALFSPVYLFL